MSLDVTVSLREAALQLGRMTPPFGKNRLALPRLLALLRAGQVRAGFYFMTATPSWISIPLSHWAKVDQLAFRSLKISDGKGTYKLSISKLSDEYAQLIETVTKNDILRTELKAVVALATQRWEVVLNGREWEQYLQHEGLQEPEPLQKGRPPKAAWRDVAYMLPAYLILNNRTSPKDWKTDHIATEIEQFAREQGVLHPPKLKPIIADLRHLVERLAGVKKQ
jgi:hypothetical protein